VRVGIDVSRPLPTGFPMVKKDLYVLWNPFKYEKLGSVSYGCCILGHDIKDCPDEETQKLWKEGITLGIHGNWLKAENSEFQPGIDLVRLNKYNKTSVAGRSQTTLQWNRWMKLVLHRLGG
jgi:hypothetical protein